MTATRDWRADRVACYSQVPPGINPARDLKDANIMSILGDIGRVTVAGAIVCQLTACGDGKPSQPSTSASGGQVSSGVGGSAIGTGSGGDGTGTSSGGSGAVGMGGSTSGATGGDTGSTGVGGTTGDPSIAVAASAPHRAEAFEACRYAIEEAKRRLPVWKRESLADGTHRWREG